VTSPVTTLPLTFDGVDVQDSDLGIFLQITAGLNDVPEVRGIDVTIPSLAGKTPRNRKADRLRILLAGWVRGNGVDTTSQRSDYRTNVKTIRTLFDPTQTPKVLSVDLEDGTVATINARPLSLAWNDVLPSEFSYVSVELESVDPDWVFTAMGS
jgi:hypothetical protein